MKNRTAITFISALAMSSGASAVTLFEEDNFSYELEGDLQIQLLQDTGVDEDLDINFDDGELKNRISYDLGNGLEAFGQLDFNVSDDSNVEREEAYVGMGYGSFEFLYGSTDYVTDDFGIENSIDVGGVDGDVFPVDSSDDVLAFRYKTNYGAGDMLLGLSTDLEVNNDPSSIDLFALVSVGPAEFGLAYQSASNLGIGGIASVDVDTFGISAQYDAGVVSAAIAYSSADVDGVAFPDSIVNINAVLIAPILDTTEISLGYETIDVGDSVVVGADTDRWYVNATYEFPQASNVSTFVEIGQADIEGVSGIDLGFLAGLRLKF